jgi:hypothetical protein
LATEQRFTLDELANAKIGFGAGKRRQSSSQATALWAEAGRLPATRTIILGLNWAKSFA